MMDMFLPPNAVACADVGSERKSKTLVLSCPHKKIGKRILIYRKVKSRLMASLVSAFKDTLFSEHFVSNNAETRVKVVYKE